MRRSLAPVLALAASALLLIGCAPSTSAEPSATSSASSSPSSSPTPEVDPQIVVSLEGLTVTDESGTTSVAFDDSPALLALLEKTTGVLPEPENVEVVPGDTTPMQRYDWDGLIVLADSKGEVPAAVSITAAEVGGVPVQTAEGLHVGSTRADLLDAGAWALVDAEDAATAADLGLGEQEVPDTESLTHPGSVGILYVLFSLEGDTVTRINAPANDFSDL